MPVVHAPRISPVVAEVAEYTHIERPSSIDPETWAHICRVNEAAVATAPPLGASQRQAIRDAFNTPVMAD